MKTICLYFEIHQIVHLKRYRFFDIGTDHYYYDDYENERTITDIAERSYMPALSTLGDMIKENGRFFKVAFSLSGVGMEQLELYAPQVIEKLQELNKTGCVEFLAEPYAHGLSALKDPASFAAAVKMQCQKMGWKSPHYVYSCALAPKLKLLLRDVALSDDISLRFNDSSWEGFPLFADQYIDRIAAFPAEEQVINIFMELSALGIAQPLSSNILNFIHALPHFARNKNITFSTPSDICKNFTSVGELDVPDTLSWVDEERDVSSWLGNPMQREAFDKLYSVAERVRICKEPRIMQDWNYLQASNNFRFMTTKPSNVGIDRGIYSSAFDAFTNYMNILGDFMNRVNALYPSDIDDEQLNSLLTTIRNEDEELAMKDREIARLKAKLLKTEAAVDKLRVKYEGKERARRAPKDHTVPQTAEEKTAGNSKK